MDARSFFSSKLTLVVLTAAFVLLGGLKYRQYQKQVSIEAEKQKLMAQAEAYQQKNEELKRSLDYLNSEEYRERVARENLNLKKEGEIAFNFSFKEAEAASVGGNTGKPESNPSKWWRYFFGGEL